MNTSQQPEALRLAHKYEVEGFLGEHKFAQNKWCRDAATELLRQHARIAELEASENRTITQRDHCEEVIDRMADAVLGKDRHEWTSNYDYMDAAQEVEDRIAKLETERAAIIAEKNEYKYALRHAQNELEAQLSAISAGGVEPLRKPAAVAVPDEREAFEHHFRADDLRRDPDEPEQYLNGHVQTQWEGWQARAAIAAQAKQGGAVAMRTETEIAKAKADSEYDCPHCWGTGEGQYDSQICSVCCGKGVCPK